MAESLQLLGGVLLLIAGAALLIVFVYRGFGDAWPMRRIEWWALPTAGLILVMVGRWLVA